MPSIGDRLRGLRLQNRISLEKVSLDTKIGVRLLEAIEAEQFEKLPGGVFRRSFVLQYARALGIDPDEIAGELDQLTKFDEVPALPTPEMLRGINPPTSAGSSFTGSTFGSLLAAVGVILVCALLYSWWQKPHVASTAPKTEVVAAKPVPPAPEQAAAPAPAPEETPAPMVRVALSVGEKTWISISSDGKNVFSSVLEPNETKFVEASEKVRLQIGNAGGVEITLNGKPIGPVGSRGEVRTVEFTQAGFQIVPPKPPTLSPL